MAITFKCTHCGNELTVPDDAAGKTGRCGRCGTRNTVPVPDDGFLLDPTPPAAQPAAPLPPPSPFAFVEPSRPLPGEHIPAGPYVPYATDQRERGETASGFCSMIVYKLQAVWCVLGWLLFGLTALGGFIGYQSHNPVLAMVLGAASGPLWLAWWVIDAVDQRISATQFTVGILLMFTCCGGLFVWVYYWLYVRD